MKSMIELSLTGLVLVGLLCQAQSTPEPAAPAMTPLREAQEESQRGSARQYHREGQGLPHVRS